MADNEEVIMPWYEDAFEVELIEPAVKVLSVVTDLMNFDLSIGRTEDPVGLESAVRGLGRVVVALRKLMLGDYQAALTLPPTCGEAEVVRKNKVEELPDWVQFALQPQEGEVLEADIDYSCLRHLPYPEMVKIIAHAELAPEGGGGGRRGRAGRNGGDGVSLELSGYQSELIDCGVGVLRVALDQLKLNGEHQLSDEMVERGDPVTVVLDVLLENFEEAIDAVELINKKLRKLIPAEMTTRKEWQWRNWGGGD